MAILYRHAENKQEALSLSLSLSLSLAFPLISEIISSKAPGKASL